MWQEQEQNTLSGDEGLRLAPVCFDSSLPSPSTLILWKCKKFWLKTGQLYLWSFLTQLPWLVAPWSHFLIQWFGGESKDLLYWSQSKCALSVCLRVNFLEKQPQMSICCSEYWFLKLHLLLEVNFFCDLSLFHLYIIYTFRIFM